MPPKVKDRPAESDLLPPIPKEAAAPLRRKVLDTLRDSIVDGRLKPGARLVERELIGQLGVSRTLVREALRQLESEGLIDVVPNKGAVVRDLTPAEAKQLYAIRAVLEGLAARLFCESATANDFAELEASFGRVVAAYQDGDLSGIITTKNAFYEILFQGAKNTILYPMIGSLYARIWRWRVLGLSHPNRSRGRSRESVAGMRALLAAIRKRDAELAERLAREEAGKAEVEVTRLLEQSSA